MTHDNGEESSMLLLLPLTITLYKKATMVVFKLRLVMVGGITCMCPWRAPFLYATTATIDMVMVA